MAPSNKRKRVVEEQVEEEDTALGNEGDDDRTLEFGWEEQRTHTGGRQRKQAAAAKKKLKPGTFGELYIVQLLCIGWQALHEHATCG